MKFSASVILSLSFIRANAKYDVIPYAGIATATFSKNVAWTSSSAESLVDGKVDEAGGGLSYSAPSCDVLDADIGYITVDLGSSQMLDGIRLYLHNDGKQAFEYCNVAVSIWDAGEPEPIGFPQTVTTPLGAPPPNVVADALDVEDTLEVELNPFKDADEPRAEDPALPPDGPTPTPASTPAPNPSPTAPPGGMECLVCGDLDSRRPCSDMELVLQTKEVCPDEKPYCMNDIYQHDTTVHHYRRCVSLPVCDSLWFQATSDNPLCLNFDPQSPEPSLDCHLCCYGNMCNLDANPPAHTLYCPDSGACARTGSRALVEKDTTMTRSLVVSNATAIFSTGSNHELSGGASKTGMIEIPTASSTSARYIRVWIGRNSVDDEAGILEVQPLKLAAKKASSSGDPHFSTWSDTKFDFHGGCDLVLLQNPTFANGLGLNVHIRTKIDTWWSYIDSAVVQIGKDTLEVAGGEDGGKYWVNGEAGGELKDGDGVFLSAFKAVFKHVSNKQKRFRIDFGKGDVMSIETYKDFVRVNLRAKNANNFVDAAGLMGHYPSGVMMARDGRTVLSDPNEFGLEWQVLASEPMLFHAPGDVQPPMQCAMPDKTTKNLRRRLGESWISEEDAGLACASVVEEERDACIFDVLATGDKDMAGAY